MRGGLLRRAPRPLPAWWPEGQPWPPREAVEPRQMPAWWPRGETWPPLRSASTGVSHDAFSLRVAVLFAIAVNVAGGIVLALTRDLTSSMGPYALSFSTLLLVAATAGAFLVAMRRIGAPLSDVVAAAHRVGSGDLSVRLEEHGVPWLRTLAAAFNTMTSRLERQQEERRALMADIAHELRTPVAVIQGRVEGMLDGVYPRDERHVRQVLEHTRMLARLVEDLRTSAHAEGGTLSLQKEPTDLGVLIEDVAHGQAPDAGQRNVRIESQVAGDVATIDVDPHRIREVLLNLLSNAVRHSPDGGMVTIDCERTPAGVRIRVIDGGPGIPAVDRSRIFERFYKGCGSTGSGLGLTIARGLVEAHGGTIAAGSHPDGGTVMTVVLPDA
jgi:signal transduction histidine kinase